MHQTSFYYLLEIRQPNLISLYVAHFKDGFGLTTDATKACCFAVAKSARLHLSDMQRKYPTLLKYDDIKIEQHGFEHLDRQGTK